MDKKDFKEQLWYLYGIRIEKLIPGHKLFIGYKRYHTMGTTSEVVMDFKTANNHWVIGWHHTHPGVKSINPSATDNKTMRSWVKAIYKTYICGIHCNGREVFYFYYVDGMTKSKTTRVSKKKMFISFLGNFFIAGIKS